MQSPHVAGGSTCIVRVFFGVPPECESVSVSSSLYLSASCPSPSSIPDFLTLSLKASLCLSPSVRLSCRLSSPLSTYVIAFLRVSCLSPSSRSAPGAALRSPRALPARALRARARAPARAALARPHTLSLSLSLSGRFMVNPGPFIGWPLTGLDLTPPLIG